VQLNTHHWKSWPGPHGTSAIVGCDCAEFILRRHCSVELRRMCKSFRGLTNYGGHVRRQHKLSPALAKGNRSKLGWCCCCCCSCLSWCGWYFGIACLSGLFLVAECSWPSVSNIALPVCWSEFRIALDIRVCNKSSLGSDDFVLGHSFLAPWLCRGQDCIDWVHSLQIPWETVWLHLPFCPGKSFAKSQTTGPGYWVAKSQTTRPEWLDLGLYGRCDERMGGFVWF
jgi:hypothetical protein